MNLCEPRSSLVTCARSVLRPQHYERRPVRLREGRGQTLVTGAYASCMYVSFTNAPRKINKSATHQIMAKPRRLCMCSRPSSPVPTLHSLPQNSAMLSRSPCALGKAAYEALQEQVASGAFQGRTRSAAPRMSGFAGLQPVLLFDKVWNLASLNRRTCRIRSPSVRSIASHLVAPGRIASASAKWRRLSPLLVPHLRSST